MNEKELKDKVEEYRGKISKVNKEISGIVRELRWRQKEAVKLRSLRDESNEACKRLSAEAKELRDKRDDLHRKIAGLKEERGKLASRVKSLSGDIKESKVMRDELNKMAQGTDKSLAKRYEKLLHALYNEDVPLAKEKVFFDELFSIGERMEAARKANDFHQKVVSTYGGLREVDLEIDSLSDSIRSMADESEKYHLRVIEIYKKLDEIRKQGDEYHKQLLERYEQMNPLRDRITALKGDIAAVETEMSPYAEQLDAIKARRDAERKEQQAQEAKEKLKSSKRISFDDFKALMEADGLEDKGGVSGG